MNERIRELIKAADLDVHKFWNDDETNQLGIFAELIIAECINCCDDIDTIQKHYEKYHLDMELGAGQCIEVIKKHFGVEE